MSGPSRTSLAVFVALLALAVGAGCAGGRGGRGAGVPPVGLPPEAGEEATPRPATGARPGTGAKAGEGDTPAGVPAPAGGRPRPGYERRVDRLAGIDASALRGRRIALDPGHGGRFPGSIGSRGLTESAVNLGVALHLWGLLVDAGAEVFMTRTADRDFPAPGDSSLRADLASRVERSNAWGPEVFLSIHHNADPGRRNDVNEIQTYYRFDDPGASLELGNALHRRLKRNLEIDADRVIPGNFHVIRNSDAPAVLGESSYLTNPDVEARLQLGAKQRLEAEAFFLGLVDYFARGVPRVLATRLDPATDALGPATDPREASERPWIGLEADRRLDGARLVLDDVAIDSAQVAFVPRGAGGLARYRPAVPLTDGRHIARWTVRAAGGGWSRTVRDTFTMDLPVDRLVFEAQPSGGVAEGQIVALSLRALDRHGRALADTLHATFGSRVGAVLVDSLAPRAPRGLPGEARAYARITGGAVAALHARVVPGSFVPASLGAHELTLQLAAPGAPPAWTTGFARALDGRPVAGARISAGDSLGVFANADGYYALPASPLAVAARAPGYVTAGDSGAALRLAPIGGGALLGRRIAIDPGGGGADTTALRLADSLVVGALGAAGDSTARRRAQVIEADANLRVARALRAYLEAAGARVVLTRDRPESLTSIDRLRRTEAFAPDRVIVLSHRAAAGQAGIGHYFSSTGGKALARRMADRLEKRDVVRGAGVSESGSYVVAQTAAVAVAVNLPAATPLDVEAARGARAPGDEAYALYLALLEDLGSDAKAWQEVNVVTERGGVPAAGVAVTLDGRWTLISDAKGRVRFEGLPRGARVTLEANGVRAAVTTPTDKPVKVDLGAGRP